jgi:hypothetical protein
MEVVIVFVPLLYYMGQRQYLEIRLFSFEIIHIKEGFRIDWQFDEMH